METIGILGGAWITGSWADAGVLWAQRSPEAAVLMALASSVTFFLVVIVGGAARKI